jgi:hypothetical protein
MKQQVEVSLAYVTEYETKNTPSDLREFIQYLNELLADVPEGNRDSAQIDINLESGEYNSPTVKIYYYRIETDEEEAAREQDEERRKLRAAAASEAQDRAEFERLKRKFGG